MRIVKMKQIITPGLKGRLKNTCTLQALLGIENKFFQLLSVIAEFYLGKALYCKIT
jgi:hypothetical protein